MQQDPLNDAKKNIDALLLAINGGRQGAFAELVEAIYPDLKRIAVHHLARAFDCPLDGLTLTPTALVADVVMEVTRQRVEWQNSQHFFAIATRLMLRLIQHYQRDRRAQKRGSGNRGADLPDDDDALRAAMPAGPDEDVINALEGLLGEYPRPAEVLTLHVFGSLSLPKVAAIMNLSLATIERDWRFASSQLRYRLEKRA